MATKPQPGSVAVKRATTGRLYFTDQLTPGVYDGGEIDLGNVVKWKRKNKTETVEHMKSEGGVRIVDDERVHTRIRIRLHALDEFGPTALELIQRPMRTRPSPRPGLLLIR